MQALLTLSGAIDAISKFAGKVAEYLIMLCALICAFNAMSRYLFNASSNGWLEIQWYLFAYVVLLGASYTLQTNGHVRVDLIYGNVSPRKRLWIDLFGLIFFLFPVTIFVTWACWPFFYASYGACFSGMPVPQGSWSSPLDWFGLVKWNFQAIAYPAAYCETSSNASGLIRWPVKLLLVMGFALLFLQGVSELIKRIGALAGKTHVDTEYEKPLQ